MFVCADCGSSSPRAGRCTADGTVRTMTDDAFLGVEVGPYRLARLLGRGGMGRVYLGVQPAVGGRVAIKLLSDDACDKPELVDRFFTEARAVNLIHHEGIVRVLDFTQVASGRPAIVMELVDGRTLREIIQAGRLPLGGVVQVMIEVLTALHAAHEIGIVHRDLKPDNVIVTASGRAKVLDFGIAKLAASAPVAGPRTRTDATLGTPHYMSPEQIGRGTVDARSDVYAAGVVMFEAVARRRPFEGLRDFDLMLAHVESPPPSPREFRPDLPQALADVIVRALAKRRGDRFESANAMANALHEASAAIPPGEWRSLAPHGRKLTRSSTPPASIPPAPAVTGPLEIRASGVRRAGPDSVTDRVAEHVGLPQAMLAAIARRRAAGDASPVPAAAVPEPVATRPEPAAARSTHPADRSAAPPDVAGPAPAKPAPRWRRVVVPLIAACTGGAVVALVMNVAGSHPAERLPDQRIPAIAPAVDRPPDHAADAGTAAAPSDADDAAIPTTPIPTTPPVVPAGRLVQPIDFDPHRFDPSAYLVTARSLAHKLLPDAELTMMTFRAVQPGGRVDFDFAPSGEVIWYMFRSPAPPERPAGVPARARDRDCSVIVAVSKDHVLVVTSRNGCDAAIIAPPRCTAAEVWSAALGAGAPRDRLASIAWLHRARAAAPGPRWYFDTTTTGVPGGVLAWYDDCATAGPAAIAPAAGP